MGFLINLFSFLAAITFLVFIHEYGHFKVARLCGIKVKRFSIGFGKPFYTKTDRYGTEWALAPILMGGYVSMADSRVAPLEPGEENGAFDKKNLWQRSAVVIAGPLANLIFAWIAWSFMLCGPVEEMAPYFGHPISGSIADKAGFKPNDKIVSVDGVAVTTLTEAQLALIQDALNQHDATLIVARDGSTATLFLALSEISAATASGADGLAALGFANPAGAKLPARVKTIVADSPSAQAGLRPGDLVVSINGQPIDSWSGMGAIVNASAGKPLSFVVERAGQPIEIDITPKVPEKSILSYGKIGATVEDKKLTAEQKAAAFVSIDRGILAAMAESAKRCAKISELTLDAISSMVSGKSGSSGISGPVGIAQQAGDAADGGAKSFISFLAFLSMSLFLMNLLPLPALDGGHLVLFAIEGTLGRPLSEKTQAVIGQIGFSFLALLMVVALFNDLSKLFH